MRMLAAIKLQNFMQAESIRRIFSGFKNLRNNHSTIPVLHNAVALADVAETEPHLPLMVELKGHLMGSIEAEAIAMRHRGNL